MSKRKRGPKRSHLSRFASTRMNVYQGPNPAALSVYHNTVKTVSGPKNDAEPVLENSFTRPIKDGVPGRLQCICGKGPFYTTVQYDLHVRKLGRLSDHEPIFEPDRVNNRIYTVDRSSDDVKVMSYDIPTPKQEKEEKYKVWQSRNRQGFDEWKWIRIAQGLKFVLHLGFNGAVWKLKKERDGEVFYSLEFSSKDEALLYWDNNLVRWLKSP